MPVAAGLHYETYGREDAPPLVLSSGLGGLASYWAPNVEALSERRRVIAYDQRGTGRSVAALPSSLIVPVPEPSASVAWLGEPSVTLKRSAPSNSVSSVIATLTVCRVTPGAKLSVPAAAP